jgi:hypothetical protein
MKRVTSAYPSDSRLTVLGVILVSTKNGLSLVRKLIEELKPSIDSTLRVISLVSPCSISISSLLADNLKFSPRKALTGFIIEPAGFYSEIFDAKSK